MATLVFTQHLRRLLDVPEIDTEATNLSAALDDAFHASPQLRGYALEIVQNRDA